jgi:hypothetical protein
MLSTRPIMAPQLADAPLNLLPPLTISLYIQNNASVSEWSWWQPSLNFSLAILNCAPDAAPYLEWNVTSSYPAAFRCSQYCPINHFATDQSRLHANAEYLLDDIFLKAFTLQQLSQLNAVPCSPFRISVTARLPPSTPHNRHLFLNDEHAKHDIVWQHQFHAATQRISKVKSSRVVWRHAAKAVSHKLCESAASYPNCTSDNCFQIYNPSTRTVLTSFLFENNRSVSVVALAASVKHTPRQRALFEALVWAEFEDGCGTDDVFTLHCVGLKLELEITCDVAGNTVRGSIRQDLVTRRYREAVVSCDFPEHLFKRHVGQVVVTLSDATKGFKMVLFMCPLARETIVRKLVACSQPIYNAQFLEKRWPGVLQAWVLYHVRCTSRFTHQSTLPRAARNVIVIPNSVNFLVAHHTLAHAPADQAHRV